MTTIAKWMFPFVAGACIATGCSDEDNRYNTDYQWLAIKEARDAWDGSSCNKKIVLEEEQTSDTVIYISASLYQNQPAPADCTVDIVVAADSLQKAIELSATENTAYQVYKDALLMDESYYDLSANQITMKAGATVSDSVAITIHRGALLRDPIRAENENAIFVLPLQIVNSSSLVINDVVNTLMLMFQLPQLDPTKPDMTDPKQEIDGMSLVWNDEFNGTGAPDPAKWGLEEGFQRNQELQWYKKEGNAEMDGNGNMVFIAKRERVANPNYEAGSSDWKKNRQYAEYTSASMNSSGKFEFKYGRLLVRAKIPTDLGAWPAIWTCGNWWEWPLNGEIDLLEYYLVDGKPSLHANFCWGSDTRWSGKWQSYNRPLEEFTAKDPQWAEKYHIWRMDWDEEYLRLYIDDELMNEIALSQTMNGSGGDSRLEGAYQNPFSNDYEGFGAYVWLNLAVGSNGGDPSDSEFPMKYYVDYVRVYQ